MRTKRDVKEDWEDGLGSKRISDVLQVRDNVLSHMIVEGKAKGNEMEAKGTPKAKERLKSVGKECSGKLGGSKEGHS